MTITYPISQCKREVEAISDWLQANQFSAHIKDFALQMRDKWQYRLTEATNQAVELNRAIIERWDTASLIRVIETGHNPYMTVAALRLICEDTYHIGSLAIGCIIRDTNSLHSQFEIWQEINILEGELDRRRVATVSPHIGE